MAYLGEILKECNSCPLRKTALRPVFGEGDFSSNVLIVGEAPGETEEIEGSPFIGRAGNLLNSILLDAGLSRKEVYIHNVVCCRPPNNNITLPNSKIALKTCPRLHLLPLINQLNPKVIISLGNVSYKFFFNSEGITRKRGIVKKWGKFPVVPTLHPAFLLRGNLHLRNQVVDDFKKAIEFLVSPRTEIQVKILSSTEELLTLEKEIETAGRVAIDIETTGLNPYSGDKIIGIGFSYNRNSGNYVVVRNRSFIGNDVEDALSKENLAIIKRICEETAAKTFHNALFDIEFLREDLGIVVNNLKADSMVLSHIVDENSPNNLDFLSNLYYKDLFGFKTETKEWITKHANQSFASLPLEIIANRCAKDTIATFRLTEDLTKEVQKDTALYKYYKAFHLDIFPAILNIQKSGFKIDMEYIDKATALYAKCKENVTNKIYKIAGYKFNIDSTLELSALFSKLNFPVIKRTSIDNKISTDKQTLLDLQQKTNHPILTYLIAYSKIEKILSTYLVALKESAVDSVVHSRLHTSLVVTDRLSSSKPNQQNIAGCKHIKQAICSRDGYVFIYGDLKQAETRVFAFLSGDNSLLAACDTADIYKTMASVMFKTDTVTDVLRQFSKRMVLGTLYGMGEDALAAHLHTSKKHSAEVRNQFFSAFPNVEKFVSDTIEFAHKNCYVRSPFGGIRRFPRINVDPPGLVGRYERQAVNYIVQNSTANFVKRSLIRVEDVLCKFDGRIVITVHDSIMCEIRKEQLDEFAPYFVAAMSDPIPPLIVPMKVDLKTGSNWWNLEKYKLN